MISSDAVEQYYKAGEIASKVREQVKSVVEEDKPLIEICEKIEGMIRDLGGKPAFPCNISVNDVAAHYTSPIGDEKRIPEGSIVKIDIGVHIDGYIADTATTVCFNTDYEGMVHAAEKALEAAIRIMRPGISTSKVGSEIQGVIESYGFKPISNLTGHLISRYTIHAGKSLPNISHSFPSRILEGEIYAIEPFVTVRNAAGRVKNGPEMHIFRFTKRRPLKSSESRTLLKHIENEFHTLPFAQRWLKEYLTEDKYRSAFSELLGSKCLMGYPVFVEASGCTVAQVEHTVYVGSRGVTVLT
ncbi:MAG: type II methionyl aminopeptidase [Nitrososphaerota archaeon]|nr:type II methionyl aminopeptidase [Candidatus Bathyarchaeota archaeon]MDW8048907.1 type II methionyl aminopeptidase [Nitrososphaerota archaeon]